MLGSKTIAFGPKLGGAVLGGRALALAVTDSASRSSPRARTVDRIFNTGILPLPDAPDRAQMAPSRVPPPSSGYIAPLHPAGTGFALPKSCRRQSASSTTGHS